MVADKEASDVEMDLCVNSTEDWAAAFGMEPVKGEVKEERDTAVDSAAEIKMKQEEIQL